MADSSAIDDALVAALLADSTLMALVPDGVYVDEAAPNAQRFVIVSLVDAPDTQGFGGRAFETPLYLVKAVTLATSGTNVKAAAARIDAVLENAQLTIAGYACLKVQRDSRFRVTTVDAQDASLRWHHRGGRYEIMVQPT